MSTIVTYCNIYNIHKKNNYRCNQESNCENGEDENFCSQIIIPNGYNRNQEKQIFY